MSKRKSKLFRNIAAVCMVLICAVLVGCWENTEINGTTPATPTTNTQPTESTPSYTVQLVTKGGMPLQGKEITVYGDALRTQKLGVIKTDENGFATYTGYIDDACYMVLSEWIRYQGFVAEPYYVVREAQTKLEVDTALIEKDCGVELGQIMCEIETIDWDRNRFLLSQKIAEGKPCVIWYVCSITHTKEFLLRLQALYERYGEQLEILMYVHESSASNVWRLMQEISVTFPVATDYGDVPDWVGLDHFYVIDRYGRMAMVDNHKNVDEVILQAIATYFTDENYRQDRVFESGSRLVDYMESLKSTEDVTYRVKVVDGDGKQMVGIRLKISYPYRTFTILTDGQGIASWTMYWRDDIQVSFSNEESKENHTFENEGAFEPGATEKTLIMREREKTTYTVRAIDTEGNPVRGVNIRTRPHAKFISTNEDGLVQWEGVIVEEPFEVQDSHLHPVPDGYVLGPVTREGDVFTVLLYPIVTYKIKVVDKDGNPLNSVWVTFYEEANEESMAACATREDGVATLQTKAGKFLVRIDKREYVNGTYYEWRYGVFVLEEGETEVTFVVGEPEKVKIE